MKKVFEVLGILVLIGLFCLNAFLLLPTKKVFGGVGDTPNTVSLTVSTATTTSATLPVLVAASNYNRRSGEIINDASTGTLYFYLQNFASGIAASTTVLANNGIAVAAGAHYQINGTNLYLGQIWVNSSTVGTKNVIFNEGQ